MISFWSILGAIAAVLSFGSSVSANEARLSCEDLYIVVPEQSTTNPDLRDGGVFYLYEQKGSNGRYQPKGYLPAGALVRSTTNSLDTDEVDDKDTTREEISTPGFGKVPYLYMVSEFGDYGYVRMKHLKKLESYVQEASLTFNCAPSFGLVIPTSWNREVELKALKADAGTSELKNAAVPSFNRRISASLSSPPEGSVNFFFQA